MKDLEGLKKEEPIDYIIGWKPFLNCHIDLSYRPLIPRPETEFWVEKVIGEINRIKSSKKIRVLDIFSGSGCVGIGVINNCFGSQVDFAELDGDLVKQIKKNLEINSIASAKVFQSDIFSDISDQYDFILANPPYIAKSREEKVGENVLKYEPHKALFGGQDGLDIIKKFLKQAPKHLKQGGAIWLEFDSFQKREIEILLREYGYGNWQFFKDQYNRWRFVRLTFDS